MSSSERFSLYCLDDNDDYLGAVSCWYFEKSWLGSTAQVRGQLRLSTKRLFFDPESRQSPVLFYTVKEVTSVTLERQNGLIASLRFRCSSVRKGFQNGVIAPLKAHDLREEWHFVLSEDRTATFDGFLQAVVEHRNVDTLLRRREHELLVAGDDAAFVVKRVLPLREQRGVLKVHEGDFTYHPAFAVGAHGAVRSHALDVSYVLSRWIVFEDVGLDIYSRSNTLLLALRFRSQEEKARAVIALQKRAGVQQYTASIREVIVQWQTRKISNYDYLLWLNKMASRSFADFSQYPVFPWVLGDYTTTELKLSDDSVYRDLSKPIGALNHARLSELKARRAHFAAMEEETYLYATHYSSAASVAYYMVRPHVEYQLSLQQGKLDSPQRIFESISALWKSVLEGSSNYKELIPEFFSSEFTRLAAAPSFDLGVKDDGTRVSPTVLLPAWAHSPDIFWRTNLAALESDYVSGHLHEWVDLIFGAKQDGEAASSADNTFHPFCYPQSKCAGPRKGVGLSAQMYAKEFGQVPMKLFTSPHPSRNDSSSFVQCTLPFQLVTCDTDDGRKELLALCDVIESTPAYNTSAEQFDVDSHPNCEHFALRRVAVAPCHPLCHITGLVELAMFSSPGRGSGGVLAATEKSESHLALYDVFSGDRLRCFSDFDSPIAHLRSLGDRIGVFTMGGSLYVIHLPSCTVEDQVRGIARASVSVSLYSRSFLAFADSEACVTAWITDGDNAILSLVRSPPCTTYEASSSVVALCEDVHNEWLICASADGEIIITSADGSVLSAFETLLHEGARLLNVASVPSAVIVLLQDEVRWHSFDGAPLTSLSVNNISQWMVSMISGSSLPIGWSDFHSGCVVVSCEEKRLETITCDPEVDGSPVAVCGEHLVCFGAGECLHLCSLTPVCGAKSPTSF